MQRVLAASGCCDEATLSLRREIKRGVQAGTGAALARSLDHFSLRQSHSRARPCATGLVVVL